VIAARRTVLAIAAASALVLLGVAIAVLHDPRTGTTPSVEPERPAGQCPDAGLTLLFSVTPATASLGQPLMVRLRVKNSGGRPCTRTFDAFTVTTQWREATPYHQSTCKAGAAVVRTLQPGEDFEWAATTWAAAPGGCPWAAESTIPVPPGTWHGTITAHYADRSSTVSVTIAST
jgi:hypothetical protein